MGGGYVQLRKLIFVFRTNARVRATNKQQSNRATPAVAGVTQPPNKHDYNNWQTYSRWFRNPDPTAIRADISCSWNAQKLVIYSIS